MVRLWLRFGEVLFGGGGRWRSGMPFFCQIVMRGATTTLLVLCAKGMFTPTVQFKMKGG